MCVVLTSDGSLVAPLLLQKIAKNLVSATFFLAGLIMHFLHHSPVMIGGCPKAYNFFDILMCHICRKPLFLRNFAL